MVRGLFVVTMMFCFAASADDDVVGKDDSGPPAMRRPGTAKEFCDNLTNIPFTKKKSLAHLRRALGLPSDALGARAKNSLGHFKRAGFVDLLKTSGFNMADYSIGSIFIYKGGKGCGGPSGNVMVRCGKNQIFVGGALAGLERVRPACVSGVMISPSWIVSEPNVEPTQKVQTLPAKAPVSPTAAGAKPEAQSAKPAVPATKPAVQPAKPAVPATKPAVQPTKPAVQSAQPAASTTQPAVPTTQPAVPTTQPAVPTTQPAVPTTQPAVPTTQPAVPTTQPAVPTTQPAVPTTQPAVQPTKPAGAG